MILHRNLASLNYQAFIRFNDISILPKINNNGNVVLKNCTIEKNTKLYLDTNMILADANNYAIEYFAFPKDKQINMIQDTISKYEIVLRFQEEQEIRNTVKILYNLVRLNMTLLDVLQLEIYEERCKHYVVELQNIFKAYPEVFNEIENI